MRPPAERQSALRNPLNDILSTEVNVRVLRVLAASSGPVGKGEVARRAALNASGVRRSLDALVELGVLEAVGDARGQLVALRPDHPLVPTLKKLFEAEAEAFARFLDRLRSAIADLTPPPDSVWIEGPAATGADRPGETVTLGLLASSRDVDALASELESRTIELVREYGILLDVRRWTAADLATHERPRWTEDEVIPLLGPPPTAFVKGESSDAKRREARPRTHADLDRRALRIARRVADRLARDASLVDVARAHVERRLKVASARERKNLLEWHELLTNLSVAQLRKLLVDEGERATRLRQSLPFVDALSSDERREAVEAHDVAASKLVTFRERDREFVRALLREGLVRADEVIARIEALPCDAEERARLAEWVRITAADR